MTSASTPAGRSPESAGRRLRRPGLVLALLSLAASVRILAAVPGAVSLPDAAERSEWDTVRTLLADRADVHAAQADGMTALHWAARQGDVDTVTRLLQAGARPDATNHFGITPLAIACQVGDGPVVEALLAAGADAGAPQRGGETPLMTAARTGRPGPVAALLRAGADVNARERRGQTALMWAAAEGHADVVRMLLGAGAERDAALPGSGFTAFHFAVREGRADVVRVLLDAGVDVRSTLEPERPTLKGPRKGTSALILAVENGHLELALELVAAGADPNDQRSGHAPLHVLSWVRKPQRGEDIGDPAPVGSGSVGTLRFARELVKAGADVNRRLESGKGGAGQFSHRGATPFLFAAFTADLPYLKLLLELGADPTVPNVDGCTPLMVACGIGVGGSAANEVAGEEPEVLEVAEFLLGLGADINAVDANGETAMHGAALKNLPQVVRFLAGRGAKVDVWNRKNRYGWTPLDLARGHRPGNFKPSFETIAAVEAVMREAAE